MQYVALLRAINVGGRVVRMDELRRLFASIGFAGARTFIASGNVIFEAAARDSARLESSVEKGLEQALGYPVATFVRPAPELVALAEHPLVSGRTLPAGRSLFVMFLRTVPSKDVVRRVKALANEVETFDFHERQVLWTIRGKLLDSQVSGSQLGKALAMEVTVRNATTVRKLAKIVATEMP